MPDMSLKKYPVPEQRPEVRNRNFDEVTLMYPEDVAVREAQRCLHCKNRPCVSGCPVNVQIPDFIAQIARHDFEDAYETITRTNSLPAVCGRVCPQESQCESKCVRGIKGEPVAIGRLERFAADTHRLAGESRKSEAPAGNGHKVGVIGSGPAGLTCAGDLRRMGYDVTVFEAFHKPGGVLIYGIPEFRLPKAIVLDEVNKLRAIGVKVETDMVIGRVLSIDELIHDYGFEALFVGTGAGLPRFMDIPGESCIGVYSANEFLTRVNLMKAYDSSYDTPIRHSRSVAVVGGGNVAMDAARCALRLGAEHVYIVYRRSETEMPARREEVRHARQEGIEFHLLTNPVAIHGDEKDVVKGIECVKMRLGEPDASGRRRPVPVEGSNYTLDVDTVVMAIGTTPNPLLRQTTQGLETDRRGCLIVDDALQTTREGVYAGGDAVTGAATVILAMGAGKQAARSIDAYIQAKQAKK